MSKYGEFKYGEGVFGSSGGSSPIFPSEVDERVAWRFFDGVNAYDLLVNPSAATMPVQKKRLNYKPTTAGRVVTYEGRPEVPTFNLSGTTLTEEQYRNFVSWSKLRKQIRITDDLGQEYWVYIKTYEPSRRNSHEYPWLMDYTISGVVLDRG